MINLFPKTRLGKWSAILILYSIFSLGMLYFFIFLGERGGMTFFSNLKLAFSGISTAVSGIAAFFTGFISIIMRKERSVLVFLSTFLGMLVLLFVLGEILFPH